MGELSKDPTGRFDQITASLKALQTLLKTHGFAELIRLSQYAAEAEAKEISQRNPDKAASLLKAADLLDEPYEKIRNDFKI